MDKRKILGAKGEMAVKRYLLKQGLILVGQNKRLGHLELDLIFKDKDRLAFIEVKTFQGNQKITSETFLSKKQLKRLNGAIINYCIKTGWPLEKTRLDLIVVFPDANALSASLRIYRDILN